MSSRSASDNRNGARVLAGSEGRREVSSQRGVKVVRVPVIESFDDGCNGFAGLRRAVLPRLFLVIRKAARGTVVRCRTGRRNPYRAGRSARPGECAEGVVGLGIHYLSRHVHLAQSVALALVEQLDCAGEEQRGLVRAVDDLHVDLLLLL